MLLPKIDHIKEGLVRFFCLVPYDLITLEVWEKVMSHWIEAINKVGGYCRLCCWSGVALDRGNYQG